MAPPAAALPPSAATTSRSVVRRTASTRSFMASRLVQDSVAGSAQASMTWRWMPLEKKSRLPPSTSTEVGRASAYRYAASSLRHWPVLMAPPGNEKDRNPASPRCR
jgi:hypothetical protein